MYIILIFRCNKLIKFILVTIRLERDNDSRSVTKYYK